MLPGTEGQFCVKHHADDPHRSRPRPLRAEDVIVTADFSSRARKDISLTPSILLENWADTYLL
jgi:hypothetical protein